MCSCVLREPHHHLPGNKGPAPTPTAAVIVALLRSVTMVPLRVGALEVCHVHGWQDDYGIVCDALGIDHSWDAVSIMPQNRQANATPA